MLLPLRLFSHYWAAKLFKDSIVHRCVECLLFLIQKIYSHAISYQPDYHVGLLLVWITYVSSISIEAASMSAASSFLPHSIDRALAIFDRLICDTLFTVQSIGAHASQDVTGDSQRPRRLVRIRMMLADWLVCLSQFIRAKLEFLHHVDYYYPIMLFEIRKYYAIEIMKPMLTAYKPFQSKMGQIAKDSLRIGLFLFPNDIHLQLYLKKSIPSLQRPISVIYFFWAIHLCDEIMSTYLFSTGGTLQTFHSLWETKLCLRVGEAVQMEKLSRGPFPVFYASVLERVNHSFENYVAVSSVGSKLMPRVWSLYIEALCEKGCDNEDLRRSFYRAIHQCPWSKRIWMLASGPDLRQAFTDKELNELKKVMEEKGIMQRIFLQ